MRLRPAVAQLAGAARAMGVEISEAQAATLADFQAILEARAVGLGIIAEADRGRIRERHLLDCLRAATTVDPLDRQAYDLGSGAGLPGIVVAIARPDLRLTLVEARSGRVAFLEFAVSQLGLANVRVRHARAEDLMEPVELCFARALSSLETSWRIARRLLEPAGRLVYFAGSRWEMPDQPLEAASSCLVTGPVLESSGPLVIIARQ